ncbi:hypothetical protein GQ54DRAFT_149999 [Martensiomyces pterosporus]|nr:hypothetical protein GQ54DRAFT_149999 [Martensiomyces pterosporus]
MPRLLPFGRLHCIPIVLLCPSPNHYAHAVSAFFIFTQRCYSYHWSCQRAHSSDTSHAPCLWVYIARKFLGGKQAHFISQWVRLALGFILTQAPNKNNARST